MPKIWNKYSQKRNIGASVSISIFMCLWANYIFPQWVCLFCGRKYVDWSWEYINHSQTHEYGNWDWGPDIPFLGIFVSNFRHFVFAVWYVSNHFNSVNFISFQKRNIGASVSISIFMCLWANYIFPRWVCLFCGRKYVDWSWEYINHSKTHECGNWGWGHAIPRKGIYKWNCRCSAWCSYLQYRHRSILLNDLKSH
jgi:hypothetical protein